MSYYSRIIVLSANSGVFVPSIIGIVMLAITFIGTIFLLVAVSMHKPKFLLPWLITFGISAIYSFGMFMFFGVIYIIEGINTNDSEIQSAAFSTGIAYIVFGSLMGGRHLKYLAQTYIY